MATVLNRKKSPLEIKEAMERFNRRAIEVHQCDKGVCLVSLLDGSQMLWVDLASAFDETLVPRPANYSSQWEQQKRVITTKVSKIFGLSVMFLY